MGFWKSWLKEQLTVYSTTRLVKVRSPSIAITSWVLFVIVWISVLAMVRLDIRRAYKSSCPVRGAVISKVKGFVSTDHLTDAQLGMDHPNLYRSTWDPTDLVYPVQGGEGETGSFAIVTNLVITPNQKLGTCVEFNGTKCHADSDCKNKTGGWATETHGVYTGKCENRTTSCQIKGWCPPEKDLLPRQGRWPLLQDVANFTLFLKNTVDFPGCGDDYHGSNVANKSLEYLRTCMYNKTTDPLCPKFRIGDIVEWTKTPFNYAAVKGGVFRIRIKWKCDFDYGQTTKDCGLKYKFSRVDDIDSSLAKGWNFQTVHFSPNGERTLKKQYGLKIIIGLEGEGRKFDFFLLITTFGSTIGFFSLTPLVCDYLVDIFNALRKREKMKGNHHEYCDRFVDGCNSGRKDSDDQGNNGKNGGVLDKNGVSVNDDLHGTAINLDDIRSD